jgi:catechol 2,3-dioxygenase-like lactoylglutathione lyase family enzyme
MRITSVVPQLRTTNLAESIAFYTQKLGFELQFVAEDFYAGIRAGAGRFHLKLVDEADPSIDYVEHGGHLHLYFETDDVDAAAEELKSKGVALERDVWNTPWNTREFVIRDNQGHTLYFAQPL